MATKSFSTDFKFTTKSARALSEAINSSKRVDIVNKNQIEDFSNKSHQEIHKQFDSIFGRE